MLDYQWPCHSQPLKKFNRSSSPSRSAILKIESFFAKRLGTDAILVPSGRAALGLVFRFLELNRSHMVFAPKYSSFCIWDAVGRYANPTTSLHEKADAVIAVHKWGKIEKLRHRESHGVVIEDSIDTIFENANSLFPHDGLCELISLPKITGSYYGGIVLTRNPKLGAFIRSSRKLNRKLGAHQSSLRHAEASGKAPAFESWAAAEALNTSLEGNGIQAALDSLSCFSRASDTIRARLEIARNRLGKIDYDASSGRLPPVLTFAVSRSMSDSDVMIRNRNMSGYLDEPRFEPSALLPLHFGVSDKKFAQLLKLIENQVR